MNDMASGVQETSREQPLRIGIVAGEASGDLLGAHLMRALKIRYPAAMFVGIGGPKMLSVGMQELFPLEKLAVRGYVEVLRHYREIVGIRRRVKNFFLANPPRLFIGIDAPDFNLPLERRLKSAGTPTVHYVSPSVWAWRGGRIRKIGRAVSHVLALFPFEAEIYHEAGIPVTYVGHPLADLLPEAPSREAMRTQLKLPRDKRVIALLPGSRQSEVEHLAELFLQTARRIVRQRPDTIFLVPLVSRETRRLFEEAIVRLNAQDLALTVLFGHAHEAIIAADIALVASGTATLEAALLKTPMVITYKMPALSWWIMRRKAYLPYAGLPNILAGRFVVPELMQEDATADNLAQALLNWLDDPGSMEALTRAFLRLHHRLRQNTADKAAQAISQYLESAS